MTPAAATAEAHDGHRPGTSGYRHLNLAVGMAGFAAFGILYSTQPLLPQLSDEFGVSPTAASLTVSAGTGALALAVIPMTGLAAAVGRVRVMRAGLVLSVALMVLSCVVPQFWMLVAVRALIGLALGGVVATAMAHVGAEVHRSGLGASMGLYVAGNSLGGVGGRVVTSTVGDLGGSWRLADGALALCAVVATVAFWLLLPPARNEQRARLRPRTFVRPLRAHLRNRALLIVIVVPFVLMGGFVAVYNFLTYRLVGEPFDLPPRAVGLVFLAYLAGTASSAVAGRLADRYGQRVVLVGSIVVMAAGLALTLPDRLPAVVAGLVVFTAGFFGAHAVASGWVPELAHGYVTQATGLYVLAYYAGSAVFGSLVGTAWNSAGWPGTAGAVGALVAVGLGAALTVRTGRDDMRGGAEVLAPTRPRDQGMRTTTEGRRHERDRNDQ